MKKLTIKLGDENLRYLLFHLLIFFFYPFIILKRFRMIENNSRWGKLMKRPFDPFIR